MVNVGRKTSTKRCEKCKQLGHNKRTCGKVPKRSMRGRNAEEPDAPSSSTMENNESNAGGNRTPIASQQFGNVGIQSEATPQATHSAQTPVQSQQCHDVSTSETRKTMKRQRMDEIPTQQSHATVGSSGGNNVSQGHPIEANANRSPTARAILAKINAERARVGNFSL